MYDHSHQKFYHDLLIEIYLQLSAFDKHLFGRIAQLKQLLRQLLRRKTSCFYPGLIPGQGKIMNVPAFNHEVNMVLWTLFTNNNALTLVVLVELPFACA